jgi:hypothetical protein
MAHLIRFDDAVDDADHDLSSKNSKTLYESLNKFNNPQGDAAAAARRQSFNEMKPQPGMFGKMWNKSVWLPAKGRRLTVL